MHVCQVQFILSLHKYYGELRVGFIFQANLACIINKLIMAENKLRKVNLRYYKASGIYIAKNITLENKCEKIKKAIKVLIIYYILGTST